MSTLIHTFKLEDVTNVVGDIGCIEDDCGWEFPDALVAVHTWSKSAQDTGVSTDCEGNYVITSSVEAIAYSANFWGSEKTQLDGKKSKPLLNLDNEENKRLFEVDLKHPESVRVQESAMDPVDKMFRQIELDVNRRFKNIL